VARDGVCDLVSEHDGESCLVLTCRSSSITTNFH
jgi:hypothetical protein